MTVKKGDRRQSDHSLSPEAAAEQAERDVATGRHREAIEGYRRLVRTEPRPAWKAGLARAYVGRARALAAKALHREAAAMLADAEAADGAVHEPALRLACLWRAGDHAKAAEAAVRFVAADGVSAAERERLATVTAALRLCVSVPPSAGGPRAADGDPHAAAERALAAWTGGSPEAEVDAALAAIPLRSPYRPLRLVLKALTTEDDAARRQTLLDKAASDGVGAFDAVVAVARVALEEDAERALTGLAGLGRHGRGLVSALRESRPGPVRALVALLEAETRGPEALLDALASQGDVLPPDLARQVGLDLLAAAPSRRSAFERRFGRLTAFEDLRCAARAALAEADWLTYRDRWQTYAEAALATDEPDRRLEAALVYLHLAKAGPEGAPGGYGGRHDDRGDPVAAWLARAVEADPETPETREALADRLTEIGDLKHRDHALEDAVKVLPDHPGLLLRALDAAAGRGTQQKAAALAERLLAVDPINATARQRLAEARVAHARKKLAEGRADLAAKALDGVAPAESGAAAGLVTLARGFLALRRDGDPAAWNTVRAGVERLGGGVAGWAQAILEGRACGIKDTALKPAEAALAQAVEAAPTEPSEVLAALAVLNRPEYRGVALAKGGRLGRLRAWLQRAAALPHMVDEFVAVAEALSRLDEWTLLESFAQAAIRRDRDEPVFAFFAIVARAEGKASRLRYFDFERLESLAQRAAEAGNSRLVVRLHKFLRPLIGDPLSPPLFDEPDDLGGFEDAILGMLAGGIRLPQALVGELIEVAFPALAEGATTARIVGLLIDEFDGHPLLRGWSKAKLTKELSTMIDSLREFVRLAETMAPPPGARRRR